MGISTIPMICLEEPTKQKRAALSLYLGLGLALYIDLDPIFFLVVVRIKEQLPHAVAVKVGAAASPGFVWEGSSFFFFTGPPNPEKWLLGEAW